MDDLVKRVQATIDQPDKPNVIAMHVDDAAGLLARIEALEARIAKADALAEVMANPCRSDDSFYEYFQEDVDKALAAYREGSQ